MSAKNINNLCPVGEQYTLKSEVKSLLASIKQLENDEMLKLERKLPSNCYFLSSDNILSYGNDNGDARYPYACDGLTLWAYASGNVIMEESTFKVFPFTAEAKEPRLAFFMGEKRQDGYSPISILGTAKQPIEKGVKRYCVYTPQAAYYFAETDKILAVVRMLVDDKKLLRFSIYIENLAKEEVETYLATYINPFLMQAESESIETKWFKSCRAETNFYTFQTVESPNRNISLEHYALFVRSGYEGVARQTTSRKVFNGSMHNQLNCSTALQVGDFKTDKLYTEFTETAIMGEILPITLTAGENVSVSYTAIFSDDEKKLNDVFSYCEMKDIDEYMAKKKMGGAEQVFGKIPELSFISPTQKNYFDVSDVLLNWFIKNVFQQVEFCSRAKNYAGSLIGIRDIFQQLEAVLMWCPDVARAKIKDALGYIGENGRAPRQYSYPMAEGVLPKMDLREFVDQGVWIISTVYSYLAFTGDYSLLEEECGYYKFDKDKVDFCKERDSVLEHLIRITNYLLANIAEDTGCLRALYGDWNDALDGLGKTEDSQKEYGSGVSVMATLQLYKNLEEMCEILLHVKSNSDYIVQYTQHKEKIRESLQKYALVESEMGERKILHGWGDQRKYLVGSYCDNDGLSRDGLTSNAFWVLSGAIDWDDSLRDDILSAYYRLDSKYGLKTFEPYFAKGSQGVGRIVKLPKGTAENGATYIHATLFAILSLFDLGESKAAWEQLYKILPITHQWISTTPFVMPNSYIYNEELGFDGESMSDWFTGSGCVLVKALVRYILGVRPSLDEVLIMPANYIPMEMLKGSFIVKGCEISVIYKNEGKEQRTFLVDGQTQESFYNQKSKAYYITLSNEQLKKKAITIQVND